MRSPGTANRNMPTRVGHKAAKLHPISGTGWLSLEGSDLLNWHSCKTTGSLPQGPQLRTGWNLDSPR